MREIVQILVLVAVAFTGCGQKTAGRSSDTGVANSDSSQAADARASFSGDTLADNSDGTPAAEASTDAPADAVAENPDDKPAADARVDMPGDASPRPDGQGDLGSPVVACSDDPSVPILDAFDRGYGCGTCDSDMFFALACIGGHLACATSYVAKSGVLVTVPAGQYVVLLEDVMQKTGQCAYLKPYTYPGFALENPFLLTTSRDPALPLVLVAISSYPMIQSTFDWLVADRATGEAAIRSLVTLTDITKGEPVAYTIGNPIRNSGTGVDTLVLQPTTSLVTNHQYRVSIFPGDTQKLVNCHTFGRGTTQWLTAPQATDFYTYSRPMVATMNVTTKKGGAGYLQFSFTEPLVVADLEASPMATVAVDGTVLSGCLTPYACSASPSAQAYNLRLDLQAVPTTFTEITLRVPHAARSINGGTILDGTVGNPQATVDGNSAAYTFKAADMILTDSNTVRRWYAAGL